MNTHIDEAQEMLRTSAREFLAENCPTKAVREARSGATGLSCDLWNAMAGLGWQGLALPERCGGSSMSFLDLCLLIEELGRACVPTPFVSATAGSALLLAGAAREQDVPLLKSFALGEDLIVPALWGTAGADGTTLLPTARRANSGFTLDGAHAFVPFAAAARHFVCAARMAAQPDEVALFLLPAAAPGTALTPLESVSDDRPCILELSGAQAPDSSLICSGREAATLLELARQRIDAACCCDIAGALSWVLDDTVAYAKDRKQFGQPIGAFEVLQHYCADMHVMLEGLRVSAYHAAWRLSEGLPASRDVAVACAWAQRVVPQFLSLAHQVHGAMGVTKEHDLHLYTTHAMPPGHTLLPRADYLEAALSI